MRSVFVKNTAISLMISQTFDTPLQSMTRQVAPSEQCSKLPVRVKLKAVQIGHNEEIGEETRAQPEACPGTPAEKATVRAWRTNRDSLILIS